MPLLNRDYWVLICAQIIPLKAVKNIYGEPIADCDDFLSPKTDIWHLGLCIFEVMTLMTPHFNAVDLELQELCIIMIISF